MFRYFAIQLGVGLLLSTSICQGQGIEWTRQLDLGESEYGRAIAADSLGNVFVGGQLQDAYGNWGPDGGAEGFLSRYDAAGNLQWTKPVGFDGFDDVFGTFADNLGHVYVAGQTWENYQTSPTYVDGFLQKFNSAGDLLWSQKVSSLGPNWDNALAVSGDGIGGIYLGGQTVGIFDGVNQGTDDAFLIKFDDQGNHLWSRQFGTTNTDNVQSIAADIRGNVFVAGAWDNDFASGPAPDDAFIALFDSNGEQQWLERIDLGGFESGHVNVAVDGQGNAFVNVRRSSNPASTRFVSLRKYHADGSMIWERRLAREANREGFDGTSGMAADQQGNVYLQSQKGIAKFDSDGHMQWNIPVLRPAENLAVDGTGNVYMASQLLVETVQTPDGTGRFFDVAVAKIVDGNVSIPAGDLNLDTMLDAMDLTLLGGLIQTGEYSARADFQGDGQVDMADLQIWVRDLKRTWIGDANLDGEFNSGDLVAVFEAGQYEDDVALNSTWATGDWTGDGEFTTADLVAAFEDGGYNAGPREAVQAVPEPTTWGLLVVALLSLSFAARARRCHAA